MAPQHTLTDVLTAETAASELGCTPTTLEEYARKGDIPGIKLGREWRFPRAAFIDAINAMARKEAERRKKHRPEPTAIIPTQPARPRGRKRAQAPALPVLS